MSEEIKNPYIQGAKEIHYFASMFKRLSLLEDELRKAGDLENIIREKEAKIAELQKIEDVKDKVVAEVKAQAASILQKAQDKAQEDQTVAAQLLASAKAEQKKIDDQLKELDDRIAAKHKLLQEEDFKLRRAREQLNEIKKNL